jgi:hypothetical protein
VTGTWGRFSVAWMTRSRHVVSRSFVEREITLVVQGEVRLIVGMEISK